MPPAAAATQAQTWRMMQSRQALQRDLLPQPALWYLFMLPNPAQSPSLRVCPQPTPLACLQHRARLDQDLGSAACGTALGLCDFKAVLSRPALTLHSHTRMVGLVPGTH